MTEMRNETMGELLQVLDYIADPKNYIGPCLTSNAKGETHIAFELYDSYDNEVWTFEDLFFHICNTNDAIVPSIFAKYRLASAAEERFRKTYTRANDIKNMYMDEWLATK